MPAYSEVGGQHDFSIVESPDPSGGKGSGYARLLDCYFRSTDCSIRVSQFFNK